MIAGEHEGTPDGTLETAGAAITSLLFGQAEDEQEREAPHEPEEGNVESNDAVETEQAAPEEESEVEAESEPAKPEPRKLRVKVDGEELELPEDEVVKGYSRTEDYTRKTQKLAEERKAFQSEAEAVRAERQRYAKQLATLDEVLTVNTTEPDWDKLREGDPNVFSATWASWDQQQKALERLRTERATADAKVRADNERAMQDHLNAEKGKLLETFPTWRDPQVAKTELAELSDYARQVGFSDDDLAQVTDHRVFKMLRDAAAFRKAEKNKPAIEKKIERAKVLVPGNNNAPVKREVTELTRAKQALAKTGSARDAGAAITALLFGE